MKNHKSACDLADKALQEALDKIDELEEDDFRDAKSIIELLKENLTLWREEEEDGNNIDDLWRGTDMMPWALQSTDDLSVLLALWCISLAMTSNL